MILSLWCFALSLLALAMTTFVCFSASRTIFCFCFILPLAPFFLRKTAATGSSSGVPGDSGSADSSGRWSRKSSKTAERDQFRVQQQGFYVRGDLTVDIFQARGLRAGPAGDR